MSRRALIRSQGGWGLSGSVGTLVRLQSPDRYRSVTRVVSGCSLNQKPKSRPWSPEVGKSTSTSTLISSNSVNASIAVSS